MGEHVMHTWKASLSKKWLTPDVVGDSYREPASTYMPTEAKWEGVGSVATLSPLDSVVILTSGSKALWADRRGERAERRTEVVARRI